VDGRDESWDLSRTSHDPASPLTNLSLQTASAGVKIQSVAERLKWASGVDFSYRKLRNRDGSSLPAVPFFTNGVSLNYRAKLDYELVNIPERRLTVESGTSGQVGRVFTPSTNPFSKIAGSLLAHWLPKARGDDYEITGQFRAGKTLGDIPFDELFILGLERDNNLWLRAHIGTSHGRKGNAPLDAITFSRIGKSTRQFTTVDFFR